MGKKLRNGGMLSNYANLGWPRKLSKVNTLDQFVLVKIGEKLFGGGGIISSMHRLRMVVCYLIMSLGMALKPIEWESVTNYCL